MEESCVEAYHKASEAYQLATVVQLKHDNHEATCARRYDDWRRSTDELKGSIRGVYGMMWTTAGTAILTLLTGIAALAYFILTKGH